MEKPSNPDTGQKLAPSLQPHYSFSPKFISGGSAWTAHLPFAYDLATRVSGKLLVELGTWKGDSFFTFCQAVQERSLGTLCYAVDHWQGDGQTGKVEGDVQFFEVLRYVEANYADIAYLIRSEFSAAVSQFSERTIDLLHIDGFHTYEAVRQDFDTWLPKVREGGVIIFHDIAVRSDDNHSDFGVWRFWDEMKDSHRVWEFLHGHGLGIFINGSNPELAEWLDQATGERYLPYYVARGIDCERISRGVAALIRNEQRDEVNGLIAENSRLSHENAQLKARAWSLEKAISDHNAKPALKRGFRTIRLNGG